MAQAQDAVWLPVLPSFKDFGPAIIKGAGSEADKSGKSVGKRFGTAIVAGAAAVGAAGLAAGAALYKVGEVFDDVVDTIRVGSGASGKDLDGLVESAKRVGTRVPADFNQIGTVIADVSTRMGLTGETMDKVASQYLEAGRILGEEVDVGKTSAAFNAFGIEGDKVSGALDHLFQVSQATGLGMNEIADAAARNAPAMETLGFSFEETTAMVGSFDKAGLNSSQIMASMSKGLVTLAKDGEQPADAFKRVQGEISGFIESGDEAAALNLASEVFGTRGATQFIGALKDGALNLEDMSKAGGQTGDTILGLGEETMDFAEQWQLFKNNILVWLEPMGARVFGALGTLMGEVTQGVQLFGDAWNKNDGTMTSSGLPGMFERLGFYARQVFDYVKLTAIPALQDLGRWLMDNKSTIGIVAGVIGALLLPAFVRMGVRALASAAQTVTAFVMTKVQAISAGATFVLQSLKIVGAWVLMGAQSLFHAARMAAAWLIAMGPIGWIIAAVIGLVTLVIANWDKISKFTKEAWANITKWVTSAIEYVRVWVTTKIAQIKAIWNLVWDTISKKASDIWNGIKTTVLNAIEYVRFWVNSKIEAVKALWRLAWDAIKQKASDIWTGIKTTVLNAIEYVRSWVATKIDNIKRNWQLAWDAIKQKASDIWNGIKNTIRDVWNKGIKPVFDTIVDFIKNKVPDGFRKGVGIIEDIFNGLRNIARKPINFVIGTVYNNGLRKAINKVIGVVGGKELPELDTIPAFAKGGRAGKGWALVGEEGPELVNFSQPGRVYTAKQSRQMLDAAAGDKPSEALLPMGGLGDMLAGAWKKATDWVRGGLADVAGLILNPIKNTVAGGIEALVGDTAFGSIAANSVRNVVDGALSWIRGKDKVDVAKGLAVYDGPRGKFHRPSKGPYTSMFGPRWGGFHGGVDIAGGGPTYAALNGIVSQVGNDPVGGIFIRLNHGGGFTTYYGHNPPGGPKVRPGQQVKAGQHIGQQGQTGTATGVHVHFQTEENGRTVDPMAYLHDNGGVVNPGLSTILNRTRKPEALLNPTQWQDIHFLATRGQGQQAPQVSLQVENMFGSAEQIVNEIETQRRREITLSNLRSV